MKINLLNIFIFLSWSVYTQPIDYNNFDCATAEKVLFESLSYFRDTCQYTGGGYKYSEVYANCQNFRKNMKWHFSNDVYRLFSKPNCEQIANENRLYHVNCKELVLSKEVQDLFIPIVFADWPKNVPWTKKVAYSENGAMTTYKFATYQELATHLILIWDASVMHRGMQRSFPSTFLVETFKLDVYTQAACCVRYQHGTIWAFVNVIRGR